MNKTILEITARIANRSMATRSNYEKRMQAVKSGLARKNLPCSNFAHMFAAAGDEKSMLRAGHKPNIGIVTAYNDMLSAHQPYAKFPEIIKAAALINGATAQVAGGVPAMCDGITQGRAGMELSLLSREVISMSTAIALAHESFDAALLLGICDKIVPGLLIGALSFGHMPALFVPSGPMPSGIANKEKARVRQLYAEGKASKEELLEVEAKSYHAPGTCTFYGTANSNQIMLECMGLQPVGSSFIAANSDARIVMTRNITAALLQTKPLWQVVNVNAIVNAIVGLLASGGSTNHTIHIPAIARAAGIIVTWDDFADLSKAVPLLCRIYPNGEADVNHFHEAGGTKLLLAQLLDAGLLHDLSAGSWQLPGGSLNKSVLADIAEPFMAEGGIALVQGNIGRAIFKTSAVAEKFWRLELPAKIFRNQDEVIAAFKAGELNRDVAVVLTHQGPRANGMPELHALMPALGSLIDKGHKILLITDGRLSGASGKVPAAIHMSPEAAGGGALAKIANGDLIRLDVAAGVLETAADLNARKAVDIDLSANDYGAGREIFANLRNLMMGAEEGAGCGLLL